MTEKIIHKQGQFCLKTRIGNKKWLFGYFFLPYLLFVASCCTLKTTKQTMPEPIPFAAFGRIAVITTPHERQTITLSFSSADSLLTEAAKETNLQTLIGVLQFNPSMHPVSSVLTMNGWDVPLTGIRMMEARSPMPVNIMPEQLGKLALVQGFFDGVTLYQAHIVAVFAGTPSDLLYRLLDSSKCNDIVPYLSPIKD